MSKRALTNDAIIDALIPLARIETTGGNGRTVLARSGSSQIIRQADVWRARKVLVALGCSDWDDAPTEAADAS